LFFKGFTTRLFSSSIVNRGLRRPLFKPAVSYQQLAVSENKKDPKLIAES